jgi:hypothetical protein
MRIDNTCLAAGHSARPVTPTWTGLAALVMPTKPLTEAALCDWIAQAQVGQSLQYHEGLLMVDRTEFGALSAKERHCLNVLARRAWLACELGLVHLFSLRVREGHYRYLVVRSSTVLKPPALRACLRQAHTTPSRSTPN